LVSEDKGVAICPRTKSEKRAGDAGYLHILDESLAGRRGGPLVIHLPTRASLPDLTALALRYQRAASVDRVETFARHLGVRTESLVQFCIGWSADHLAWTFPMTNPVSGNVTGIRLRAPGGAKFAVEGGKDSLFLPRYGRSDKSTCSDLLLVTEGATDAIAGYDLGFPNVAGRPSCTGGTRHLVALAKSRKPAIVAIFADDDTPGIAGAERLASDLALYCRDLRVVTPPTGHKDLRSWVLTGATQSNLDQLIRSATPRKLTLHITRETHT
jgi:hypothetical protein